MNSECIVLIITKVEDPEELDTRFSKFAPSVHEGDEDYTDTTDTRDEVLDLFKKIHDDALAAIKNESTPKSDDAVADVPAVPVDATYIFTFSSMGDLSRCAHIVASWYDGESSLYKDTRTHEYKLLVRIGNSSPQTYNKVCNILSEYGRGNRFSESGRAYFEEHYDVICSSDALQALAMI